MPVEYLDPEIANEGIAAEADYQPMTPAPQIPDYKWIKPANKLARFFPHISGIPYQHRAFPAFLYHPVEGARLVHNAKEAAALGCRCLGPDEGYRWECTGEWQARPFPAQVKFDPKNLAAGKSLPAPSQNESVATAVATALAKSGAGAGAPALTAELIAAAVAAAMAEVMKAQGAGGNAAAAPKAQPPVKTKTAEPAAPALPPEHEKALLLEAAASRKVKVDKRWSIDRIKEELDKIDA